MNYFGMTEHQVRYEVSFQNLIMMFSSIPKFKPKEKEEEDKDEKKFSSIKGTLKVAKKIGIPIEDKRK